MLSALLSLPIGCFLFFWNLFFANLLDGWVVVRIPADQQFNTSNHACHIWVHINPLVLAFVYSCKSSPPFLQALGCCHLTSCLADCINLINSFQLISKEFQFAMPLFENDTNMCYVGMGSGTHRVKCFILWCEQTLPGSWIEVKRSRGLLGFSGAVVNVAFRLQLWSTDICTTSSPTFAFPPFWKCLHFTPLLLFSHFSGNHLSVQ